MFMYTGEVVIKRENLKNFLKTSNELKIAGLTKLANKESSEPSESKHGLSRWNQEGIEEAEEERKENANEETPGCERQVNQKHIFG